jgi:signal transduction histidine kinase
MTMVTLRSVPLSLVLGGTAALALFFSLSIHNFAPPSRWHAVSLHAALEAIGGLCAIVTAAVLFQRSRRRSDRPSGTLAVGFLAMGILEAFHAVAEPGNAFILLRSLASFFGGLGFALVWLPDSAAVDAKGRLPWITAVGTLMLGLLIVSWPDRLPDMVRNGDFSPAALAPTSLACLLFLAAGLRFFVIHRRTGELEPSLFACLSLLFGLAELMFTYSRMWDAQWWFWHGLRILGYFLVLLYLMRGYQHMVLDLQDSLRHTREANEAARRSERDLRRALDDRERMGQDLHDGIIQSLFAIGLGLERCQRLAATQPDEVTKQLGVSVTGLKAVIRDLRTYLGGTEPQIVNGRELEAALGLQLRMLQGSQDVDVSFQVDPAAAERVAPHHATDLLYIAREAMSNSLRHAQARRACLTLELCHGRVRLVVEDDGIGFDRAAIHEGEGLRNMTARAAKLSADVTVSSVPGRGTRIILELPDVPLHA